MAYAALPGSPALYAPGAFAGAVMGFAELPGSPAYYAPGGFGGAVMGGVRETSDGWQVEEDGTVWATKEEALAQLAKGAPGVSSEAFRFAWETPKIIVKEPLSEGLRNSGLPSFAIGIADTITKAYNAEKLAIDRRKREVREDARETANRNQEYRQTRAEQAELSQQVHDWLMANDPQYRANAEKLAKAGIDWATWPAAIGVVAGAVSGGAGLAAGGIIGGAATGLGVGLKYSGTTGKKLTLGNLAADAATVTGVGLEDVAAVAGIDLSDLDALVRVAGIDPSDLAAVANAAGVNLSDVRAAVGTARATLEDVAAAAGLSVPDLRALASRMGIDPSDLGSLAEAAGVSPGALDAVLVDLADIVRESNLPLSAALWRAEIAGVDPKDTVAMAKLLKVDLPGLEKEARDRARYATAGLTLEEIARFAGLTPENVRARAKAAGVALDDPVALAKVAGVSPGLVLAARDRALQVAHDVSEALELGAFVEGGSTVQQDGRDVTGEVAEQAEALRDTVRNTLLAAAAGDPDAARMIGMLALSVVERSQGVTREAVPRRVNPIDWGPYTMTDMGDVETRAVAEYLRPAWAVLRDARVVPLLGAASPPAAARWIVRDGRVSAR